MSDDLNERQLRFCREYLRHGNGARAAREAGYSEKGASHTACELLKKNEKIKKFLKEAEAEKITGPVDSSFDLKKAIAELEKIQREAESEGNHANALRSIELKSKLMGLLKDTTPTNNGFQINIVGIENTKEPSA